MFSQQLTYAYSTKMHKVTETRPFRLTLSREPQGFSHTVDNNTEPQRTQLCTPSTCQDEGS